jgi:DNA repair exonuclease SbcCD ATPase subunit
LDANKHLRLYGGVEDTSNFTDAIRVLALLRSRISGQPRKLIRGKPKNACGAVEEFIRKAIQDQKIYALYAKHATRLDWSKCSCPPFEGPFPTPKDSTLLQVILTDLDNDIAAMSNAASSIPEQVLQAAQFADLSAQIDAATQKLAQQEDALASLGERSIQSDNLDATITTQKSTLAKLIDDIEQVEAGINTKTSEFMSVLSRLEEANEQASRDNAILDAAYRERTATLNKLNSDMAARKAQGETNLAELEAKKKGLEEQIEAFASELQSAQVRKFERDAAAEALNAELSDQQSKLAELREQLKDGSNRLQKLENDRAMLDDENSLLSAQVSDAKRQLALTNAAALEAEKSLFDAREEIGSLRSTELDSLRRQVASMQAAKDEADARLARLTTLVNKTSALLEGTEVAVMDATGTVKSLDEAPEDIKNLLDTIALSGLTYLQLVSIPCLFDTVANVPGALAKVAIGTNTLEIVGTNLVATVGDDPYTILPPRRRPRV